MNSPVKIPESRIWFQKQSKPLTELRINFKQIQFANAQRSISDIQETADWPPRKPFEYGDFFRIDKHEQVL